MCATVFRFAVFAAVVTMTTSSTITQTADMVTVRLGEAIHLSCVITLTATESVSEVRWYRGSSFIPYGSIDVTSRCGNVVFPCPEESTTDNRGTVRYEIAPTQDAVMTLTINSGTLEDNTSFSCGIIRGGGSSQTSSGISVTAVYVPNSITDHQTTLETTTMRPISSRGSSTETNTDATDIAQSSHQQDVITNSETTSRKSTSTTDEQGSFSSTTTSTVSTSQETSSLGVTGVSLTIPILAAMVSVCLVIIIILLIIIAYLVSSRKRRSKDAEPRDGLRSSEDLASSITPQGNGPMYQNTSQPHTYENTLSNISHQDGDRSTSEQPSTVDALPTYYEPVQAEGGSTEHAAAQRHPGRRAQDKSAVTNGGAESGYRALDMTNQPPGEYTTLDLAIRDG